MLRLEHLSEGRDLLYHPQRGMLKSRNSQRKLAISEEMEYEKKLIAEEAEGNPRKKLNQSTEDLQIEGKNRDQTDQEFDIPHGKPNQEPNKDTKTKGRAHPRNTLASSTDTEGYKNFWQHGWDTSFARKQAKSYARTAAYNRMDAKTATSRRTMRPSKSSGSTTRIEETCYPGTSSYSACNPRAGHRTRHTKVYVEKGHGYDNSFPTPPTINGWPMT